MSELEQRLAQVNTVQQTRSTPENAGEAENRSASKDQYSRLDAKPNIQAQQVENRIQTAITPTAKIEQESVQAKLEHFYELSHKEQKVIVNHMADNYVAQYPEVNRSDAQDIVLHEILNPQRQQENEQVASR